jgi:hypothetical protein
MDTSIRSGQVWMDTNDAGMAAIAETIWKAVQEQK